VLILEERIVHLPEFSLTRRGFRSLRCKFSVRVCGQQWKVPKGKTHFALEMLEHYFHGWICLRTNGTFEVAVLDHEAGCRRIADHMIGGINRRSQRIRQRHE
jgi:hypothetical protein